MGNASILFIIPRDSLAPNVEIKNNTTLRSATGENDTYGFYSYRESIKKVVSNKLSFVFSDNSQDKFSTLLVSKFLVPSILSKLTN